MIQDVRDWGLRTSRVKNKTMVMTKGNNSGRGAIQLKGKPLDVVRSFKYLGSKIANDR